MSIFKMGKIYLPEEILFILLYYKWGSELFKEDSPIRYPVPRSGEKGHNVGFEAPFSHPLQNKKLLSIFEIKNINRNLVFNFELRF